MSKKWRLAFPVESESQRRFAYGAATFIFFVGVGVFVLSIGVSLLRSAWTGLAGFALFGTGGIIAGCILLAKWSDIELSYRAAGVLFLASGIAILVITWRLATSVVPGFGHAG